MQEDPRQCWVVRVANVADVSGLARVHLDAWLAAYRGVCADSFLDSLNVQTFEGYHRPRFDALGQPDPAQPFVVACDPAGTVVGFARAGPTRDASPTGDPLPDGFASRFDCELYAIYVHPTQQGRGIGRRLFDQIVNRLIGLGHQSMCLWVLSGNSPARAFYRHMGGIEAGEATLSLAGAAYPQVAYAWPRLISRVV